MAKRLLEEVREWSRSALVAAHAIADLRKPKTELVADNALLRLQLIVADRQIKRALFTRSERTAAAVFTLSWLTAIELYEEELTDRGNRSKSVDQTLWRVRRFFPEDDPLWSFTPKKCEKLYEELRRHYASDTHRNILSEAKSFLRWCQRKRFIRENALDGVEGKGRRKKGKPQLRFNQRRTWYQKALELGRAGDDGAVAAMMALLEGMRSYEIVSRRVRDVDERHVPCDTLWIEEILDEETKTPSSRRIVTVPEDLQPLLQRLIEGRDPFEHLFATRRGKTGFHARGWVNDQVKRICQIAEVDEVCAHSMRGTHATVSIEEGVSPHVVAMTLGHSDDKMTTGGAYAEVDASKKARQDHTWRVLKGGAAPKDGGENE